MTKTKFIPLNPRGEAFENESNDCAVRAMTLATGLPYADVHAAFKAAGRRDRRGTAWDVFKTAARALVPSVEIEHISADYQLIGNPWSRRWHAAGRPTLARFTAEHRTGAYVVIIKGHALALIEGVQLDMGPNGSRCKVQAYMKVRD